jgi:hypothetical protein
MTIMFMGEKTKKEIKTWYDCVAVPVAKQYVFLDEEPYCIEKVVWRGPRLVLALVWEE